MPRLLQVEDVNSKFVGLAELEANNWIQPEVGREGREGEGRRGGEGRREFRRCSGGRASVSEGLRAMIALRRKEAARPGRPEDAALVSPPEVVGEAGGEDLVSVKSFDGGFFTVSSPAVAARTGRRSPCLTTRSTGRPRGLDRKEVTESARRTACLVSPFISQFAKLNLSSR